MHTFGMWIHLVVAECCTMLPGNCDLDLAAVIEKTFWEAYLIYYLR